MSVRIDAVQVEHHESGFGIGYATPRLSWRFADSEATGWVQTDYEIAIALNGAERVHAVASDSNVLVPWPGHPLKSRDRAGIRVRAKGQGVWTDWAHASLEVGLLERSDWSAQLISAPSADPNAPIRLCRAFSLSSMPRARVYVTAQGLYELWINGKRVGDQLLTPGWTSYTYQFNYQTYDVTPYLRVGHNIIGCEIGEGWYAGYLAKANNNFGDRLGLMLQLELDGKVELVTDGSWSHAPTPLLFASIYNGETFDTRIDPGWTVAKNSVEVLTMPKVQLLSSDSPPVRRIMEVKPRSIITTPSGKKVLDFGQNLVGWLRVERDLEGDEVVLRHAEVMEREELGVRPLRTARCIDTLILGGKTKGWEPRFTFHGFRYAEINGVDDLDLDTFTAIVIFSDLRRTGTFECSHPSLNQLHHNVVWSMLGNFVSVPTDCPQRDERLGWTGDLQVFAPTANYLFDTAGFLTAWLKDTAAETVGYDGVVPIVIPYCFRTRPPTAHPIWGDVMVLTPWDLYHAFNDKKVLEDNWEAMKMWIDKGIKRGADTLWESLIKTYGDWLDPKSPPPYPAHGWTDPLYCANAYLVHVTGVLADIAVILGKDAEAKHYSAERARIHALFQTEYITPSGRVVADTQTGLALALQFNLLDEKQTLHAAARLNHLTRWNYFKITTGFAGTPILLLVLAQHGLLNVAYRMLQEKDNPSWLYPVTMGATTIWERWDSMLVDHSINPGEPTETTPLTSGQMTSFNHYALGSVARFLHEVVAGLAPGPRGWKEAVVQPRPGGTVSSALTSFSSPYGPYAVSWTLEGETMKVKVTVPPNASARVVLPGVEETIGSGKKSYTVTWAKDEWPPKGIPGPQSRPMEDEWIP